MKNLILTLALVATALMATTQTAVAQSSEDTRSESRTSDASAIKATIDGETKAYHAADYKTFKSYWANVPYASMLVNGQQYVGDALWKAADGIFANAKPIKATTTRTGWNIRAVGNTAFVTFEQRDENADTKTIGETVETRYLEKIGGAWKIVNVSVVPKPAK